LLICGLAETANSCPLILLNDICKKRYGLRATGQVVNAFVSGFGYMHHSVLALVVIPSISNLAAQPETEWANLGRLAHRSRRSCQQHAQVF
jgi:hypothetical protein